MNLDAYNLIGDSTQTTADALDGVTAGATDILATSDSGAPKPLAAILDTALADNGGPTLTHALVAGSPARNAGDPAAMAGVGDVPLYDQRGEPFGRVAGGRIDIGAYESQLLSLVVDTNSDVVDGDYSVGNLSLREAIELTNANPGADTVTFDAGAFTGGAANVILLDGTELEITEALEDQRAAAGREHHYRRPAEFTGHRLYRRDGGPQPHENQYRQRSVQQRSGRGRHQLLLQRRPFPRQQQRHWQQPHHRGRRHPHVQWRGDADRQHDQRQ